MTPGRDGHDKQEKDEHPGKYAVRRKYSERVRETTALCIHGFIRYYLFNYLINKQCRFLQNRLNTVDLNNNSKSHNNNAKKMFDFTCLCIQIRHTTETSSFTCQNVKDSFITPVIIKSDGQFGTDN